MGVVQWVAKIFISLFVIVIYISSAFDHRGTIQGLCLSLGAAGDVLEPNSFFFFHKHTYSTYRLCLTRQQMETFFFSYGLCVVEVTFS